MERRSRLRTRTPIKKRGKREWRAKEPAGAGTCRWCHKYSSALTWDHLVPRSLLPGPLRDDVRNLVRACGLCNSQRGSGLKPDWMLVPSISQDFIREVKGEMFITRYFTGFIPDGLLDLQGPGSHADGAQEDLHRLRAS